MNKLRLFLALAFFFFSASIISALCEGGQIDINAASLEELDKIIWVGNATAEKIIANRPFMSVDELTKVSGIGDIKLADIKSQGLACVSGEETRAEYEEKNKSNDTHLENEVKINSSLSSEPFPKPQTIKNVELKAIDLNPKAIKTDVNSKTSDKGDYAIYGLLGFGFLLGLLFLIKNFRRGNKYKNEFS